MRVLGADDMATMYTEISSNQLLTIMREDAEKQIAAQQTKSRFRASYLPGAK